MEAQLRNPRLGLFDPNSLANGAGQDAEQRRASSGTERVAGRREAGGR